jgi:hypothetical protein
MQGYHTHCLIRRFTTAITIASISNCYSWRKEVFELTLYSIEALLFKDTSITFQCIAITVAVTSPYVNKAIARRTNICLYKIVLYCNTLAGLLVLLLQQCTQVCMSSRLWSSNVCWSWRQFAGQMPYWWTLFSSIIHRALTTSYHKHARATSCSMIFPKPCGMNRHDLMSFAWQWQCDCC